MALVLRLGNSAVDGGREVSKSSPEASTCVVGAAGRIPDHQTRQPFILKFINLKLGRE